MYLSVKYVLWILTVALVSWLIWGGCSEDMPIQGFNPDEGFDPNNKGRIQSTVMATVEEVTFSDTVTVTGRSPFLLLGAFSDIETRILLKFDQIPDSVNVLGANILLRTNGLVSQSDNKSSFRASVHEVTAVWYDSTVTDESFQNAFDPNSIGGAEIISVDRGLLAGDSLIIETVRIELGVQGVEFIGDSTSLFNRFGALIDFSNSSFIKEFFSENNSRYRPQLELTVAGDSTDTKKVLIDVIEDAYLVSERIEPPAGPLYIDNIFSNQCVMKFDFSNIPRESTVNRAELQLNVLPEFSVLKGNNTFSQLNDGLTFQIQRLAAPFEAPNSFTIDSTFTPILANVNRSDASTTIPGQQFRGLFRQMIQQWVSQQVENHGFVVRTFTPGFDVSRVAFASSTSFPNDAPKLQIDFTTSPTIP